MQKQPIDQVQKYTWKIVERTQKEYFDAEDLKQKALPNSSYEEIFIPLVKHIYDTSHQKTKEYLQKNFGYEYGIGLSAARRKTIGKSWNGDIIAFASQQCNIEPFHASLVVGEMLGVTPEKCFNVFSQKNYDKENDNPYSNMVSEGIPELLKTANEDYRLKYKDLQYDYRGNLLQAVCAYTADEKSFFYMIAARTVVGNKMTLKIGFKKAKAQLLSEVAIRATSAPRVIFCLSLPVAIHFRHICRAAGLSENRLVVSGYFGKRNSLDLSSLRNRVVTIIPDFTYDGFTESMNYSKKLSRAGAKDVTIYPYPIIAEGVPETVYMEGASPWKKPLLGHAIRLTDVDAIKATEIIIQKALSATRWLSLLVKLGLASPEVDAQLSLATENPTDIANEQITDFDVEPSLDVLVQKKRILFIWGDTDSGKSLVTLEIVIALATGTPAFCFPNAGPPRKVWLLDGELDQAQFMARRQQLTSGKRTEMLLCSNLEITLTRGSQNYDLLDPEAQKRILEKIKHDKIKVFVVDPLFSFTNNQFSSSNVTKLFQFFYKVEDCGAAVIFSHHATKDGKEFKGSGDIKGRSQTVIHIEGRKDFSTDKNATEAILNALAQKGEAVVRLNFEKCKVPPALNEQNVVYHLSRDGTWRYIAGSVHDATSTADISTLAQAAPEAQRSAAPGASNVPIDETVSAAISSLKKQSRKVYQLFVDHPSREITRHEIEAEADISEDIASRAITELKSKKLIAAIGSGSNVRYVQTKAKA